jgi:hypothetical protein
MSHHVACIETNRGCERSSAILVKNDAGQSPRCDKRVGGTHPLRDLQPSIPIGVRTNRYRNPSMSTESITLRFGGGISRDDSRRLLVRKLDGEMTGFCVAEYEILPANPKRWVVAPGLDIDAFGLRQFSHDLFETLHVVHSGSILPGRL